MIRRWLIRSLFLLPLVCVVGLWVVSYFGELRLVKTTEDCIWDGGVVQGEGIMYKNRGDDLMNTSLTFYFNRGMKAEGVPYNQTTLGFYVGQWGGAWPDGMIIIFPLWLPTLLLLALNWFVWRKTRPTKVGGAFPVEPAKSAAKSK